MSLTRIMQEDEIILKDSGQTVFELKESMEDGTAVLEFIGSLRSDTANEIRDELSALAMTGLNLRLKMKDVTYLSSACAQALLQVQQLLEKSGEKEMVLKAVPEKIMDELRQTGISELLLIEE